MGAKVDPGDIRSIPIDVLCPKCKRGYMHSSTMPKSQKKLGEHWRARNCKCDRCGYAKYTYKKHFGVID